VKRDEERMKGREIIRDRRREKFRYKRHKEGLKKRIQYNDEHKNK
jgi:hypothetical protein